MPTSVQIRRERINEAKRIAVGMRWQKLGTTALTKIVRNNIIFFSFFLPSYFFLFSFGGTGNDRNEITIQTSYLIPAIVERWKNE